MSTATPATEADLLAEYRVTRSEAIRNQIAAHHMNAVHAIAMTLEEKLPHGVTRDDLVQWGAAGLMEAIERFDSTRNVKLITFATRRIRGAMWDGLRSWNVEARNTIERRSKWRKVKERLAQQLGREASPEEIEVAFPLAPTAIRPQDRVFLSLDDPIEGDDRASTQANALADRRQVDPSIKIDAATLIELAAQQLTLSQAIILKWYYIHEFPMEQIGRELIGCGASRVSQLHKAAIETMRKKVA